MEDPTEVRRLRLLPSVAAHPARPRSGHPAGAMQCYQLDGRVRVMGKGAVTHITSDGSEWTPRSLVKRGARGPSNTLEWMSCTTTPVEPIVRTSGVRPVCYRVCVPAPFAPRVFKHLGEAL